MVATSSMVYEEIVGIRGSWPQPPRTLFTREMPHNLNSVSVNSANTGSNHQAYIQQLYHRQNGDGLLQPEVYRYYYSWSLYKDTLLTGYKSGPCSINYQRFIPSSMTYKWHTDILYLMKLYNNKFNNK